MSFILLNSRAPCISLASAFCERDFGYEEGIPAGVERGGQTARSVITLLKETVDAMWERNLVGHISTACPPPALAPSPTFTHNKKRLIVCLCLCIDDISNFFVMVCSVIRCPNTYRHFPHFATANDRPFSWLVASHPLLLLRQRCDPKLGTRMNLLLGFFHNGSRLLLDPGKWMRQRLLTQHHPFLLVWVFLRDCHWLSTAGYKDVGCGISPCNSRTWFQSDLNNYSAIVTLHFPKHCAGRDPSQSHSFISGVFLGVGL